MVVHALLHVSYAMFGVDREFVSTTTLCSRAEGGWVSKKNRRLRYLCVVSADPLSGAR